MYKFGSVQKKILLAFLGGFALGSSNSPSQYFRALKAIKNDWKRIDQANFNRSLDRLLSQNILKTVTLKNGSYRLILTENGRTQARKLDLLGNSIKFKKTKKWNKQWLLVMFDIPEKDRHFRNILRHHLRELEFKKLQNSVFVSPYPFKDAILELIRIYQAERHVRVAIVTLIDNEKKLKKHFSIKYNSFK